MGTSSEKSSGSVVAQSFSGGSEGGGKICFLREDVPNQAGAEKVEFDGYLRRLPVGEPVRLPSAAGSSAVADKDTFLMRLADASGGAPRYACEIDLSGALQGNRIFIELSHIVPLPMMLSAFLHDIAQPLNVIKMAAYNLLAETGPPSNRRQARLRRIEAQTDRADALLKGLRLIAGSAMWRGRHRGIGELFSEIGALITSILDRSDVGVTIAPVDEFLIDDRTTAILPAVMIAVATDMPQLLGGKRETGRDLRIDITSLLIDARPVIRFEARLDGSARDGDALAGGRVSLNSIRLLWTELKLADIGGGVELFSGAQGVRADITLGRASVAVGDEPPSVEPTEP